MSELGASKRLEATWGSASRVFCVIAGLISMFGGLSLVGLKAAGDNSMIEALAHGIGIYCIGKGLFMIAATATLRGAVDQLMRKV